MTRFTKNVFLAFLLMLVFTAMQARAGMEAFDFGAFKAIPVLQDGRVKPLDTFARTYLKVMRGSDSLDDADAINWLAELLFAPELAINKRVFNIQSPDVVNALQLERRKDHRYSYAELVGPMQGNLETVRTLAAKPAQELSAGQEKLLELYDAVAAFDDLSNSMALVIPVIKVRDRELAKALGVKPDERLDYMSLRKKREVIESSKTEEARFIKKQMELIESHMKSGALAVVPPQWDDSSHEWLSLWDASFGGQGSPDSAKLLAAWRDMATAYDAGDAAAWKEASENALSLVMAMPRNDSTLFRLKLELLFNKFSPFTVALCFYALAFFLVTTLPRIIKNPKIAWRVSLAAILAGVAAHGAGLVMRMVIMARPPVSTLYESIIFVSFAAVFWGLFLEWKRRDGFGIAASALLGTALLFIGRRYEMEGDTMKVLVAVLDTNFWLGTHVVAITIGYASTIAGCAVAHLYLLHRVFRPDVRELQKELYANLRGLGLVAIFFTALGTILGGIWADQSWGRFWGWDPKENGALLIVLWLAWVIHGRISGILGELGVAMGMAAGGIMVSLAWFGVNLLNVGLHSYGFTRHAAFNLGIFIASELAIIFGCYIAIRVREKKQA